MPLGRLAACNINIQRLILFSIMLNKMNLGKYKKSEFDSQIAVAHCSQ